MEDHDTEEDVRHVPRCLSMFRIIFPIQAGVAIVTCVSELRMPEVAICMNFHFESLTGAHQHQTATGSPIASKS
jgi:hypothetical protein